MREKEYENYRLNENLAMVNANSKILATHIDRLMKLELNEFNIKFDCSENNSSSPASEEDLESADERHNDTERKFSDPIVKFNQFSSCMEQINMKHQKEMQKMKCLEQEMDELSEQNLILTKKLESVLDDSNKLKQDMCEEQLKNSALQKAKEQLELTVKDYENDLKIVRLEKETVTTELETMSINMRDLQDQVGSLNIQIEQYEKMKLEYTESNTQLSSQSDALQNKLRDIQGEYMIKINWLENDIKRLNDHIIKSKCELEKYEISERALKANYESVVIENERHREQFRISAQHLKQMKQELQKKEEEMLVLGDEIRLLSQKNMQLELSFQELSVKHQKQCEELASKQLECDKCIQAYEEQIKELKEKLLEQDKIINEKETEAKHLDDDLQNIEPIIQKLLQVCYTSTKKTIDLEEYQHGITDTINNITFKNVRILDKFVREILRRYSEAMSKVETLEGNQLESEARIEHLLVDINEKNRVIKQHAGNYEELLLLRSQNMEYEDRIEKLKDKQGGFIEKIKNDLQQKEDEIIKRMHVASKEYEIDLSNLRNKLNIEVEHHSNKERELILILSEHEDLKQKYRESEENLMYLKRANNHLKKSYERLIDLENRVYIADESHYQLHKEIQSHLEEIEQRTANLKDVQKIFPDILEASERFKELEDAVDVLQEDVTKCNASKFETLKELNTEKEAHREALTRIDHLRKSLEECEQQLQQFKEQNQRLSEENNEFHEKQRQTAHKNNILEESNEEFRKLVAEKDLHIESLEERYKKIENLLSNISQQHIELQNELSERDKEVDFHCDQQQQNLEDYREKLSGLMDKLSNYSQKVQSNDLAIEEILAILKISVFKNSNIMSILRAQDDEVSEKKSSNEVAPNGGCVDQSENITISIDNIFNAIGRQTDIIKGDDRNMNCLRIALNNWYHLMLQLKQQRMQLIKERQELRNVNEELNMICQKLEMQLESEKMELQKLHDDYKSKTNNHECFNDEHSCLEQLKESLTADNNRLKELVTEYEQKLEETMIKVESLTGENNRYEEDIKEKDKRIEQGEQDENKTRQALTDLRMIHAKSESRIELLENQLANKDIKLEESNRALQEFKEKASRNHLKFTSIQEQLKDLQSEHNKLVENRNRQITSVVKLEGDLVQKAKELLCVKTEYTELNEQYITLDKELLLAQNRLEEIKEQKIHIETEYSQLQTNYQQLIIDANILSNQQKNATDEIEDLRNDRNSLKEEMREVKMDLQKANDNVSQLIQQIGSIRLEKESIVEENKLLQTQLSENEQKRKDLSENVRLQTENVKVLEEKLVKTENDLKMAQSSEEKNTEMISKLNEDNLKLKNTNELTTKRVEKIAVKLGEFQQRCSKFERDNEKLNQTLESKVSMIESLQSEKDVLQNDAKSLKERLCRAESDHEQLVGKVQNLENRNELLQATKQKLELQQTENNAKIQKLEKLRDLNEEKIRKLNTDLSNSENQKVNLNLEIGALNSQLKDLEEKMKSTVANDNGRIEQLTEDLRKCTEKAEKHLLLNEELQKETNSLREENLIIKEYLTKSQTNANIHEKQCDQLNRDIGKLRSDLLILREDKVQLERDRDTMKKQLAEIEIQKDKLQQKYNDIMNMDERFIRTESQLSTNCESVETLGKEISGLMENNSSYASLIKKTSETAANELSKLRMQLSTADEALIQEQEISANLKREYDLLKMKYKDIKEKMAETTAISEERIKQNRLEMESKLEKMKTKMVSK